MSEVSKIIKVINVAKDMQVNVKEIIKKYDYLAKLNHYCILPLKVVYNDNECIKIEQEQLVCSLNEMLSNFDSYKKVLHLLKSICEGITCLNACGMFHGNLKPNNILCSKNGKYLLTDYGVNVVRATDIPRKNYLSPEMLFGLEVTNSTDIWSLGCILYNVLYKTDIFDINNLSLEHFSVNTVFSHNNFFNNVIKGCLKVNCRERINVNDLLSIINKYIDGEKSLSESNCLYLLLTKGIYPEIENFTISYGIIFYI